METEPDLLALPQHSPEPEPRLAAVPIHLQKHVEEGENGWQLTTNLLPRDLLT